MLNDASGNIQTRTKGSTTDTFTYGNTSWGDQLTAYNGQQITYDAIGNPLSYYNGQGYAFTWQNGRELATAVTNGVTSSYKYDSDGVRTEKTVDGVTTQYILEGSQVSAIKQGDIYTYYAYDTDGAPIGMFCPSTPTEELTGANEYFFVKNLQGDILKVVDNVGDTIITYHYNAWGEITSETVAVGYENIAERNIFRYRGYIYDTETQLYYLQSRYYDSKICRFINADDYVSTGTGLLGHNMFAYCLNNPINLIDPSGETAEAEGASSLVAALIAVVCLTLAAVAAPISLIVGTVAVVAGIGFGYYSLNVGVASFDDNIQLKSNKKQKKKAGKSDKEKSTDKPSWVNKDMIDMNISAQENARRLCNQKFGPGNWKKGPDNAFNQIVKWIHRSLNGIMLVSEDYDDIYIFDDGDMVIYDPTGEGFGWYNGIYYKYY